MKINKHIIQIILITSFSVFFTLFIDKNIYRPLSVRFGFPIDISNHFVFTSVSLWMLSVSLFYWINPNKILYHFLFCNLPYMIVISYYSLSKLIFLDFLHVPALVIGLFTIVKDRKQLDLNLIIYTSVFVILWLLIVNLLHLNYYDIKIFPNGFLIVLSVYLVNLLTYVILKISPKHLNTF